MLTHSLYPALSLCFTFIFSLQTAIHTVSFTVQWVHLHKHTSSLIALLAFSQRSRGTITADHIAQQHGRRSQQAPSPHLVAARP